MILCGAALAGQSVEERRFKIVGPIPCVPPEVYDRLKTWFSSREVVVKSFFETNKDLHLINQLSPSDYQILEMPSGKLHPILEPKAEITNLKK